jgi:site-specific DNA recombinase
MTTTTVKAVGYIRVSTDKQAVDGYSLAAQTAKIQAMAIVKGYELTEIVSDDESAKNLKRPGVQRVIDMVTAKRVDVVIIIKLDRFTRSVKDLAVMVELFNSKGVALVSLTESLDTKSASGELSMNITTSVSQWERRAIGERTKTALDYKRSIGERMGNIPYGYQAHGKLLAVDLDEQAVISRIKALSNAGTSQRAIATQLNAEGIRTRRGTEWKFQYIAAVLNAGTVTLAA